MTDKVRRLHRRELIAGLVGGLAALPLLAACGGPQPTATPAPKPAAPAAPTPAPAKPASEVKPTAAPAKPTAVAAPTPAPAKPTVASKPPISAKAVELSFYPSGYLPARLNPAATVKTEGFDPIVDEYKKARPNVTIKFVALPPNQNLREWGLALFSAGNAPDMLSMHANLVNEDVI